MTDLIVRPHEAPGIKAVVDTTTPRDGSLGERLISTQAPQRPQSTPVIRIEVDGRVVEGRDGQTILEVCRDNGIEVPTLCYEPKLPGFGRAGGRRSKARSTPDQLLPTSRRRDGRQDPDRARPAADDEPRADLRHHNILPAAVPEQVPTASASGFLEANAGELARSTRIFKRTSPSRRSSGGCPAPCESTAAATRSTRRSRSATATATPATRSSRRCSTRTSTRRSPSSNGQAAAESRSSAPGRPAWRRLLPAPVGRCDRLQVTRARRGAPLRHPPVPAAEGRGPRGRVRSVTRLGGEIRCGPGSAATSPSTISSSGVRRGRHRHRLLRHEQARHPERGRRQGDRQARVPPDRDAGTQYPATAESG